MNSSTLCALVARRRERFHCIGFLELRGHVHRLQQGARFEYPERVCPQADDVSRGARLPGTSRHCFTATGGSGCGTRFLIAGIDCRYAKIDLQVLVGEVPVERDRHRRQDRAAAAHVAAGADRLDEVVLGPRAEAGLLVRRQVRREARAPRARPRGLRRRDRSRSTAPPAPAPAAAASTRGGPRACASCPARARSAPSSSGVWQSSQPVVLDEVLAARDARRRSCSALARRRRSRERGRAPLKRKRGRAEDQGRAGQ